ncbi:MAG: hypothetical protein NZM42_09580 [Gemmatales bacterium]|nr:hypothetical protein [Gemmatales bacterium]
MSEETIIPARQEGQEWLCLIQAQYGGPAFVRRGKRLADAVVNLHQSLARLRQPDSEDDWLAMVRLRLGQLRCLAGDWTQLNFCLQPGSLSILEHLEKQLAPRLRLPLPPDPRRHVLLTALHELIHSIRRFNTRWLRYLQNLDLSSILLLIEEYNRYYVLEKECFLQSPRLARLGFQPMPRITWQDLLREFPLLPEPELHPNYRVA